MLDASRSTLQLISQLLHDARVLSVAWDPQLCTFAIQFDCLRRAVDGAELNERTVEIKLTGVQAIGIGYDSSSIEARPSRFEPPKRITAENLVEWPFRPLEASLSINSTAFERALESACFDWLMGDETSLKDSACTFCLRFDQWGHFGLPMLYVHIIAGGDVFTIASGGLPISIQDWEAQYAAWWAGWKKHWDSKDSTSEGGGSEFAVAIPAGESAVPDLSYRPPPEAVFQIEPTDAPVEVLSPLKEYLESQHERDWSKMARVFPNPEATHEERREQLERINVSDFGRWGYARRIDDWWLEGARACVVVRGIEHQMAFERHAAQNIETVWTFSLRHRDGNWIIDTYSQGWPKFGSAKKLPAKQKPWLRKWKSGTIDGA